MSRISEQLSPFDIKPMLWAPATATSRIAVSGAAWMFTPAWNTISGEGSSSPEEVLPDQPAWMITLWMSWWPVPSRAIPEKEWKMLWAEWWSTAPEKQPYHLSEANNWIVYNCLKMHDRLTFTFGSSSVHLICELTNIFIKVIRIWQTLGRVVLDEQQD